MKKIFISLGFLMMAFLPVFAQNSHWEYPGTPATSAVTVVHSNGIAYLFQSDGGRVYVTELDPTYMTVMNPSNYQNIQNVVLQGAYEDFNRDIVVYGSYNDCPVVALYNVNTQSITKVFYDNNYQNDYFINGCCGYDIHGNMIHMLVLEYAGTIVALDNSLNGIKMLSVTNYSGRFSDVVWDSYNSCFAAAGYQYLPYGEVQLLIFGLHYDVISILTNGFIVNSLFAWNLSGQAYAHSEFRTNLEVISDSEIAVGYCVRDNKSDWLWLSIVQNYNTVGNSSLFLFPSNKLYMSDIKYNNSLQLLTILGKMDHHCGMVNYIAQVNPAVLSGMVAAQIIGNMPNTTCYLNQNILYANDIALQKLEIDPYPCERILSTGSFNSTESYITETYDLSQSACDWLFNPYDITITPNIGTITWAQSYYWMPAFPGFNLMLSGTLNEIWSCPDFFPCSKQLQEKSIQQSSGSTKVDWTGNGLLEFSGFTGDISYRVYNITGHCVASGHTVDRAKCLQLPSNGLYVIKAEDTYGHAATTKFIYLNEQ